MSPFERVRMWKWLECERGAVFEPTHLFHTIPGSTIVHEWMVNNGKFNFVVPNNFHISRSVMKIERLFNISYLIFTVPLPYAIRMQIYGFGSIVNFHFVTMSLNLHMGFSNWLLTNSQKASMICIYVYCIFVGHIARKIASDGRKNVSTQIRMNGLGLIIM